MGWFLTDRCGNEDQEKFTNRYFYDPLDNQMRGGCDNCYVITQGHGAKAAYAQIQQMAPGGFWRLVDAEQFRKGGPNVRAVRAMAEAPRAGSPGETGETNLAPLALD